MIVGIPRGVIIDPSVIVFLRGNMQIRRSFQLFVHIALDSIKDKPVYLVKVSAYMSLLDGLHYMAYFARKGSKIIDAHYDIPAKQLKYLKDPECISEN